MKEWAGEERAQVSEAQIAVHWREEEYYQPPEKFINQANAADPAILERFSEQHFPDCFKEYAELLDWDKDWDSILDTSNAPFWKWFVGGRLNASHNCVDRHLEARGDQAAFIWVPEPEDEETETITYRQLGDTSLTSQARQSTTRTSTLRTRTGVSPTSDGSPGTPTSFMDPWRSEPRA